MGTAVTGAEGTSPSSLMLLPGGGSSLWLLLSAAKASLNSGVSQTGLTPA